MTIIQRLSIAVLITVACSSASLAQGARIVEWVDFAPTTDTSKIALGYAVPQPVDTPLPFNGFRSYSGLHMRHQDLAATTPWVHGSVIGQTRHERPIWVYQLGDANRFTVTGLPEQAMLSNGGIHAREWQSPEVTTGIIELLALSDDGNPLIEYLRDNANMLVIPVLNVDGFIQTQRYPSLNWLGTDPNYPDTSPRDGRMRRKNMLSADEDLYTQGDHLQGVDLNRNSGPYWASNPNRSSDDSNSIVHHGAFVASEPEIQALDAAAQLGPASQLSMYTDLHSYSQVHFYGRSDNTRLANLTESLLETFTDHHAAFPAGKYYWYDSWRNVPYNQGIGLSEERFTHVYQVPSWTLEIEPSGGSHDGLPGNGADYGGLSRNGHDGFILPESEVERVRTELAQSFAVAYYQQSGPPSMRAYRVVDAATTAVVFDAEWDVKSDSTRELFTYQPQALQFGRDYIVWIAWDKPMRWREDGAITPLPGQTERTLEFERGFQLEDGLLSHQLGETEWLSQPGGAPLGFLDYRDDALAFSLSLPDDTTNRASITARTPIQFETTVTDMVEWRIDAFPETAARWQDGGWAGYENTNGVVGVDNGGTDSSIRFDVTPETLGAPFVVEAGTSSAWYDPGRDGEGFLLEILPQSRAVMYWFTYDDEGAQDWYVAEGEVRGNRILFDDLMRASGGVFGPEFDPDKVSFSPVGSAVFTWSSCSSGTMKWVIDRDGGDYRQGRMETRRLSDLMGLDCGAETQSSAPEGGLSGSWYDPGHNGEGYVLEVLADGRALVYWFSYDTEGKRRWFFGLGSMEDGKLAFPEMLTSSGARFGDAFDPGDVSRDPWGSLELDLQCSGGKAVFAPTELGFPAGELDLVRLTAIDGLECDS